MGSWKEGDSGEVEGEWTRRLSVHRYEREGGGVCWVRESGPKRRGGDERSGEMGWC